MSVSINGTGGITFADASTQNTGGYTGFRNRIINGAMMIDQRNNGAALNSIASGVTYTVDRWFYQCSQAGKFNAQQNAGAVTPPQGFNNYLGFTSTGVFSPASTDYIGVSQAIEGYNWNSLSWGTADAQAVTLSFVVRSSLAGTHSGAIRVYGSARSYPFTFSISSADTWETKTVVIPGDTSGTYNKTNSGAVLVCFNLGSGSNYLASSGSWTAQDSFGATGSVSVVGTNGATFYITGVQLEKGSVATPFEFRQYGTELALCQRYYEQANFPVAGVCRYASGVWQSEGNITIPYKTVKRGSTSTTVSLAGSIDNCSSVSLTNDLYDSGFILGFTVINASYPYMRANILYKASGEL